MNIVIHMNSDFGYIRKDKLREFATQEIYYGPRQITVLLHIKSLLCFKYLAVSQ